MRLHVFSSVQPDQSVHSFASLNATSAEVLLLVRLPTMTPIWPVLLALLLVLTLDRCTPFTYRSRLVLVLTTASTLACPNPCWMAVLEPWRTEVKRMLRELS